MGGLGWVGSGLEIENGGNYTKTPSSPPVGPPVSFPSGRGNADKECRSGNAGRGLIFRRLRVIISLP